MAWRFLVDEDTAAQTAMELADRGVEAVTVADALQKGEPDASVVEFAKREHRILITADREFLDPAHRHDIQVFMVADNRTSGAALAERVAELVALAADPDDLKPVTWI